MLRFALGLLLSSSFVCAQAPAPLQTQTATVTASTVTTQAIAAFSALPVTQIQLSGTAKAYAGSSQPSGTFTATLKSTGESTLQLNMDALSRTETAGPWASPPQCAWTGTDGVQHSAADHNCRVALTWLVPDLTLQARVTSLAQQLSAASETAPGTYRLSLSESHSEFSPDLNTLLNNLSTAKLAVDQITFLPATLDFNLHPDKDANTNIAIEVRYTDYRQVNGATIPFHIQRYLNNGLALDLQVETAVVQ